MKKYFCEFIGTLVLVLFGCGTALFTDGDIVATSLAFGLAIVAMAYSIGKISGCHVNPAVSLAMLINKKLSTKEFCGYVAAQVLGSIAATAVLYALVNSQAIIDFGTLGANGYDSLSALHLNLVGAMITEIILTCVFVFTILGVTSDEEKSNVAGIIIGLTLTFVHLIGINLTGTSVNPARSIGPALFVGGKSLEQLWLFICAPLIGSVLAAYTHKFLNSKTRKSKK